MPTVSHPHLHGRPFGSALLSISDFNAWLRRHNLHFPVPSLNDGDFFQIETLLVTVELEAGSISDEEAAAVVSADPFLSTDPMASLNPRWLVGAEAHRKWRVRITDAVIDCELVPLDFGSKLPLVPPVTATMRRSTTTQAASGTAADRPATKSVTKAQVLMAFGDLASGMNLAKAMGDGATLWLSDALISKGTRGRGGHQAQWDPLILAVALHGRKLATKAALNRAFLNHSFLANWREAWAEQEAELD